MVFMCNVPKEKEKMNKEGIQLFSKKKAKNGRWVFDNNEILSFEELNNIIYSIAHKELKITPKWNLMFSKKEMDDLNATFIADRVDIALKNRLKLNLTKSVPKLKTVVKE